jgi:hypothetical protein
VVHCTPTAVVPLFIKHCVLFIIREHVCCTVLLWCWMRRYAEVHRWRPCCGLAWAGRWVAAGICLAEHVAAASVGFMVCGRDKEHMPYAGLSGVSTVVAADGWHAPVLKRVLVSPWC